MGRNSKHITYVFDLDNTLVITNVANNESYKDAIRMVVNRNISISSRRRITRHNLITVVPDLSSVQVEKIIRMKELFFSRYMDSTMLNKYLTKMLKKLHECGNETILLTNSHMARALQVCSFYGLDQFFSSQYYFENYQCNKYQFLKDKGYDMESIVLFENDSKSIRVAASNGIDINNIIKVKF